MNETRLAQIIGLLTGLYIAGLVAIIIFYPPPTGDKILVAGVLTAGYLGAMPGLFSFRQSLVNTAIQKEAAEVGTATAAKLAIIAPKVDLAVVQATAAATQATAAVDAVAGNTELTQETHGLVNGQATHLAEQTLKFQEALVEMTNYKTEIAEQKSEIAALVKAAQTALAIIAAHTAGIAAGRAQLLAESASVPAGESADGAPIGAGLARAETSG